MRLELSTPEATRQAGRELAAGLQAGAVLGLTGDLGAGKTELVKGIAEGLGFRGDVTSPTFTLLQEYRGGRLPLYHADWYRLRSGAELDALGLEEWFEGDGVAVIEWAERFSGRLPRGARWLTLTIRPDGVRVLEERPEPPTEEGG